MLVSLTKTAVYHPSVILEICMEYEMWDPYDGESEGYFSAYAAEYFGSSLQTFWRDVRSPCRGQIYRRWKIFLCLKLNF